jgi:cbb3-type cytochrome oxidase maturation protein
MSVIYVLLIASAFIGLGFLGLFISSVKQGQFDDTWSPARRMLIDDDKVTTINKQTGTVDPSVRNDGSSATSKETNV